MEELDNLRVKKMKINPNIKTVSMVIAGTMSLGTLTSCNDFLNVTPEGQEKLETILSTPEGIESALYGVYSQMRTSNLYGSNLSFRVIDILAQHFTVYGGNNDHIAALENYNYSYSDVETDFENIWTKMYNNISNVNAVLECELLRDPVTFPYTIYKGEALALRGFMHFDLLRLFCEQITLNPGATGIPYSTEFSLNTPDFSTAAECYQFILKDLLEAEKLLGDEDEYVDTQDFMRDRCIHLNLHAVRATLARVYLTMGNKEMALNYAQKVIEESGKKLTGMISLAGDVAGILSANETIFGVYYNEFYSLVSPNLQQHVSWSSLEPRRDCRDIFTKDGQDLRFTAYFQEEPAYSVPTFIKLTDTYELNGLSRPADVIPGINMIRIPEMYYIVAECLLESNPTLAQEYFDTVIEHRGLTKLSERPEPLTLNQTIINEERYKELWGEGQNFYNFKRQDLSISLPDGSMVKPVYIIPIPDIEFDYRY